jgi:hypothetical protein
MTWDFFIAYSSQDKTAAATLYRLLIKRRTRVFLDRRRLLPGATWSTDLKNALAGSRLTVVLISRHSDKAWYQQEEIAIAIRLAREQATAHSVVPVLLRGARLSDVSYGLNRLTLLRQDDSGLEEVARDLVTSLKQLRRQPGTAMLGHATGMLDDMWSDIEPVLTDRPRRMPEQYRIRFVNEGPDLLSKQRGKEMVRITPRQFSRRLTASQLDYVETLERSMAVNRALWKKEYPKRVISGVSKTRVRHAVAAMAEDLQGVLHMLETAGFWLDDHYLEVRRIVREAQRRPAKS